MAGRKNETSVHAAARDSLKALKKAKGGRTPASESRALRAERASKKAAARHPAAARVSPLTKLTLAKLGKRALAVTHAVSAGFTASRLPWTT